jgi:hypothetical protein
MEIDCDSTTPGHSAVRAGPGRTGLRGSTGFSSARCFEMDITDMIRRDKCTYCMEAWDEVILG